MKKDRLGLRYGKLVVQSEADSNRRGSWWTCLCDCGNKKVVSGNNLNSGNTKSCGCLLRGENLIGKRFGNLEPALRTGSVKRTGAFWLCRCDCGVFKTVQASNLKSGSTRSCGRCVDRKGENAPGWRGGVRPTRNGYIRIYAPEHPNASGDGYVMEHRLVMSRKLGRALLPSETVHHLNGIRYDNREENLELWTTSQPSGKRVCDQVEHAVRILRLYAPKLLQEQGEEGA